MTTPARPGKGPPKVTTKASLMASELAKLGKGVPRKFSEAEKNRRRERLAAARKKRWPRLRKPV